MSRHLSVGVVVQLVRTPACHAGGRGFESLPSRQTNADFIKSPTKRFFVIMAYMKVFSILSILIVVLIGAYIWRGQLTSVTSLVNKIPLNNFVSSTNPIVSPKDLIKNIKIPISKLDLSNKGLKQVPMETFDNIGVQYLDLSNNDISGSIPAEIREMVNLEILDLSNNRMTGLPAEIGQLRFLRVLNLANNNLTGLPYELGNLKNLQVLNLSGNNYSEADLDIIKMGLPSNVQIIK